MSAAGREGVLEVVRFAAADGLRLAIEARHVQAMLGAPPAGAVTIESLLGLPPADPDAPRRWLRCGARIFEVSEPVALGTLAATAIHPLPALVAARLRLRGVRALVLDDDGVVMVVEPVCPSLGQ